MELEDIILVFIAILEELSIIRSSSVDPSSLSIDSCCDMLMNYDISSAHIVTTSKHKVLKRGSNEEVINFLTLKFRLLFSYL